jgi:hypothetical protein
MAANLLPSDEKLFKDNIAELLATAVLFAWCQQDKAEADVAERKFAISNC